MNLPCVFEPTSIQSAVQPQPHPPQETPTITRTHMQQGRGAIDLKILIIYSKN